MRAALLALVPLAGCNVILGLGDLSLAPDAHVAGDDIDAASIDAMPPDAGGPTAARNGRVIIADVRLLDTEANAIGGVRGGNIDIQYLDLTQQGGTVVYGTSTLNGCVLTHYDATHLPHPQVDAGPITLSGTGLLKPVGPCTFTNGRYYCTSDSGTGTSMSANVPANGTVAYAFPVGTFTNASTLVGAWLEISGLSNATWNGTFPIVGSSGATTLIAVVGGATAGQTATGTSSWAVHNGLSPGPFTSAQADFLSADPVSAVTVQKPDDPDGEQISFTGYPRADGFDLDDASADPATFPSTAPTGGLHYTCAGAGGNCGTEGSAVLEATILSGRATRSSIAGLLAFAMPPDPPGSDYIDFLCGYLASDDAVLPQEAVQMILDFNPTRVEVRVVRGDGTEFTDTETALDVTDVLIGHIVGGHTDNP